MWCILISLVSYVVRLMEMLILFSSRKVLLSAPPLPLLITTTLWCHFYLYCHPEYHECQVYYQLMAWI